MYPVTGIWSRAERDIERSLDRVAEPEPLGDVGHRILRIEVEVGLLQVGQAALLDVVGAAARIERFQVMDVAAVLAATVLGLVAIEGPDPVEATKSGSVPGDVDAG